MSKDQRLPNYYYVNPTSPQFQYSPIDNNVVKKQGINDNFLTQQYNNQPRQYSQSPQKIQQQQQYYSTQNQWYTQQPSQNYRSQQISVQNSMQLYSTQQQKLLNNTYQATNSQNNFQIKKFIIKNYENGVLHGQINLDNNTIDGEGIFFWNNGDFYAGQWKNNVIEGLGYFIFADGTVYKGNFENGKVNGIGELQYSDGTIKSGFWKKGTYHSDIDNFQQSVSKSDNKNIQQILQSEIYQMQLPLYFEQCLQDTLQIFKLQNNKIWIGKTENYGQLQELEFEENLQQNISLSGIGAIVSLKTNKIQYGLFKSGVLNGRGRVMFKSGDIYDGFFSNGEFSGPGVYFNNQDKKYFYGYFNNNSVGEIFSQGDDFPVKTVLEMRENQTLLLEDNTLFKRTQKTMVDQQLTIKKNIFDKEYLEKIQQISQDLFDNKIQRQDSQRINENQQFQEITPVRKYDRKQLLKPEKQNIQTLQNPISSNLSGQNSLEHKELAEQILQLEQLENLEQIKNLKNNNNKNNTNKDQELDIQQVNDDINGAILSNINNTDINTNASKQFLNNDIMENNQSNNNNTNNNQDKNKNIDNNSKILKCMNLVKQSYKDVRRISKQFQSHQIPQFSNMQFSTKNQQQNNLYQQKSQQKQKQQDINNFVNNYQKIRQEQQKSQERIPNKSKSQSRLTSNQNFSATGTLNQQLNMNQNKRFNNTSNNFLNNNINNFNNLNYNNKVQSQQPSQKQKLGDNFVNQNFNNQNLNQQRNNSSQLQNQSNHNIIRQVSQKKLNLKNVRSRYMDQNNYTKNNGRVIKTDASSKQKI